MRYYISILFLFSGLVFYACAGSRAVGEVSTFLPGQPQIAGENGVKLSNEQQRKFDYFFLEATRYKAIGEGQKSFRYYSEALKIDSTCAACSYEMGRLLLSGENFGEAEKFLEHSVRFDPENRWYIELLARVYQNNKKGQKAVQTASKLLDKSDPSVEELYLVSQLQIENEDFEGAIENLERMETILGFNEGLVLEKYQLYLNSKEFKKAEKVLRGLIKQYPRNSDYHVYLGDFFLEQGKFDKASERYNEALKLHPDNGKVFFSLANRSLQQKDNEKFKDYFLKAFRSTNVSFENKFQRFVPFLMKLDDATNPMDSTDVEEVFDVLTETHPYEPRGYVAYANFMVSANKKKRAVSLFEQALEIDARQNDVWQDYLFLLSGMDQNQKMLARAREAITFYPENPFFYLFEGVTLYQEEELEDALESFRKGLLYSNENIGLKGQFHAYMGDIYHSLDSVEESFRQYEEALAIDENNLIVLNNYAYYLSLSGRQLDKAERMSAKTVELEPANATYLDTYAWILFKKGRYMEAKFIIERAVDNLEEPSGVVWEHYGDILYKTGNESKALEIWKKASEMEDHSGLLPQKIEEERYIDENE